MVARRLFAAKPFSELNKIFPYFRLDPSENPRRNSNQHATLFIQANVFANVVWEWGAYGAGWGAYGAGASNSITSLLLAQPYACPMPVNQSWKIYVDNSHEFIKNIYVTKAKQWTTVHCYIYGLSIIISDVCRADPRQSLHPYCHHDCRVLLWQS